MPVEIVWRKARAPQRGCGIVQHGCHGLRAGNPQTLQQNAAALFQRQRVDGDVVCAKGETRVQRPAKALRRVLRQSRDQIHVHVGEVGLGHQVHGADDIRRAVAAADGPEDMVLHGLGVHGDPGDAVGLENRQLFPCDGVRPAGFHGDLVTRGCVKALFKGGEHPVHLLCRQGGGRAATHVKGANPQPCPAHHGAPGAHLIQEGLHIGRHQGEAPLHRLAHKGAVGAAGGAEGDAHVNGDVQGLQPLGGGQGHAAGLQRQPRPLQHGLHLLRGFPLPQRPGDGLVGPDAGEHAPGGLLSGDGLRRQEKALADGVTPLALPVECRAGEGAAQAVRRGLAPETQLHRHMAAIRVLSQGDDDPGVVPGQNGLIYRQLAGKEVHKTLLHHVALVVAVQYDLHRAPFVLSAWRT